MTLDQVVGAMPFKKKAEILFYENKKLAERHKGKPPEPKKLIEGRELFRFLNPAVAALRSLAEKYKVGTLLDMTMIANVVAHSLANEYINTRM